jgi:hypothetical protein
MSGERLAAHGDRNKIQVGNLFKNPKGNCDEYKNY